MLICRGPLNVPQCFRPSSPDPPPPAPLGHRGRPGWPGCAASPTMTGDRQGTPSQAILASPCLDPQPRGTAGAHTRPDTPDELTRTVPVPRWDGLLGKLWGTSDRRSPHPLGAVPPRQRPEPQPRLRHLPPQGWGHWESPHHCLLEGPHGTVGHGSRCGPIPRLRLSVCKRGRRPLAGRGAHAKLLEPPNTPAAAPQVNPGSKKPQGSAPGRRSSSRGPRRWRGEASRTPRADPGGGGRRAGGSCRPSCAPGQPRGKAETHWRACLPGR